VSAAAVIAADWLFAQLFATKKLDSGLPDNYHNRCSNSVIPSPIIFIKGMASMVKKNRDPALSAGSLFSKKVVV